MKRAFPLLLILLAGCTADGHFQFLGYSTAPNYDQSIRTVYVPIFENTTLRRGLEFQVTRAVIREIEAKTPYKVVDCLEKADTELIGKIVGRRKSLINANQVNEIREAEVMVNVEVTWRDLRPGHMGEVLSGGFRPDSRLAPNDPRNIPPPVLITPLATFIPELGGSLASAEAKLADHLGIQVVSMMEKWK